MFSETTVPPHYEAATAISASDLLSIDRDLYWKRDPRLPIAQCARELMSLRPMNPLLNARILDKRVYQKTKIDKIVDASIGRASLSAVRIDLAISFIGETRNAACSIGSRIILDIRIETGLSSDLSLLVKI